MNQNLTHKVSKIDLESYLISWAKHFIIHTKPRKKDEFLFT